MDSPRQKPYAPPGRPRDRTHIPEAPVFKNNREPFSLSMRKKAVPTENTNVSVFQKLEKVLSIDFDIFLVFEYNKQCIRMIL